MSNKEYRSEMGIIVDILGITMENGRHGSIASTISRRANLSHHALIEKCQKLIRAGLIESMLADRNRTIKITEKGIKFFLESKRFQDTVKELKIRY